MWVVILGIFLILALKPPSHKGIEEKERRMERRRQENKVRNYPTAENIGSYGEYLIVEEIKKITSFNRFITNLYIPTEKGRTTEIDIILIMGAGVYVIESKNYSGWIFGNRKSKMWTQTFPNGQKERLYNPVWQNSGHIRELKSALKVGFDIEFKSLVVFGYSCELMALSYIGEETRVIQRHELLKLLRRDEDSLDRILSDEQIVKIYESLENYKDIGGEIKVRHIENLSALHG